MAEFKLEAIPGTEKYVNLELQTKHPEISNSELHKGEISFSADKDIWEFKNLLSGLRITDQATHHTENLFRRDWRLGFVPAGINPALAYVMCQIAKLTPQDIVLDPFCGGGTIPISAALYFAVSKALASDVSGKAVDITQANAKAAHLSKNFVAFRSNVSALKLAPNSVTKIISNLPFGVRTGKHDSNIQYYNALKIQAERILVPGGKLVLLTQEKKLIGDVFRDNFQILEKIDVTQSGLIPSIFVIKHNHTV